jgi:glutamyl/glutaminyl-tRNA synthetase
MGEPMAGTGRLFHLSGEPQTIRDAIPGDVVRREENDFVIFRSNDSPVFHFANVLDDIIMGISHVIRGEDNPSNTSRHAELFHAFDAPEPVFAPFPHILKSQGSDKLSKRDGGALIGDISLQMRSEILCASLAGLRSKIARLCPSLRY